MPTLRRPGPVVAALLTAVVAVGCAGDAPLASPPEQAATAAPLPEPEPEPEPEPAPEAATPTDVRGEITEVTVADLSVANTGLYRDGHERDVSVAVDDAAVDAHVRAVADWLDAHLTDLQDGGEGRVAETGLTGDVDELSTGLTAPERPVDVARYAFTVGARGLPEWLRASVTLGREGQGDTTATFVFVPTGDDVRLVAAEPGVGTLTAGTDPTTAEDAP